MKKTRKENSSVKIETSSNNYYLVIDYADKKMANHYLVDITDEALADIDEGDYVVVSSRHGDYRLAKALGILSKNQITFRNVSGYDGDTKESAFGRYNGNYYVQKVVDKKRELAVKSAEIVAELSALADEKKKIGLSLASKMDIIMNSTPDQWPEDVKEESARMAAIKKRIELLNAKKKKLSA